MFLDYLNSTLWYNICFILFYSCFWFWFFLCKPFLIVVEKEKLKLYSLWLTYFQINQILVVLSGCAVPGKAANGDTLSRECPKCSVFPQIPEPSVACGECPLSWGPWGSFLHPPCPHNPFFPPSCPLASSVQPC